MAFATADFQDREPKTSPRVTTWKGRALLVVRSAQKKGKLTVSVKGSLLTANLIINSK
jgi:beta-galactosidase